MVLCGVPLVRRAARRLARRRLSMDALIATGAFAAYGLSLYAIVTGTTKVYFDSATAAVVLATFGRYLEASARARASQLLGPSIEVARDSAMVLVDGRERASVHAAQIEPGMELRVDVERVVPVDLMVCGAPVEVDLGVLTGESRPVRRDVGETVPAGAVVVSAPLRGIALRSARESTLERLAELSRSLRESPSALLRLADRFATALTPAIWLVALATFAYWTRASGVDQGIIAALAVVLVACPCTYAIATPLVQWLTLRRALAQGVLVRDAATLEELARVDRVAFDKTGTLTTADVRVNEIVTAPGVAREEVLGLVAALESGSRHPVARALAQCAQSTTPAALRERRFETGAGVTGIDDRGRSLALGSSRLLLRLGIEGCERVSLVREGSVLATFAVGEEIRAEAAKAIDRLRREGIDSVILTGDSAERGRGVGARLDVAVHADLTAVAKLERLDALGPRTAMVGDGLNDAPALASVGPGFAVEQGTGLARGMAAVGLLRSDLCLIPWTLALARRSTALIRRLLLFSTAYNLVFVALAAAGMLRPVFAGLSMLLSSLLTLAAAARIAASPARTAAQNDRE